MIARLKNYRFNWKLTLFAALMLPALIALGFWQLAREQEKRELLSAYENRRAAPPVALDSLDRGGDLQYMPVRMHGRFDNGRDFLLDNRVLDGRPGFEVITPFITDAGILVFVNRGWLPLGRSRQNLPAVEPVAGERTIAGTVYAPSDEPFLLGDNAESRTWPRIIQSLDAEAMAGEMDTGTGDVFPHSVRLAEGMPGALPRDWRAVNVSPAMHRGYAVQWFAMALALVVLYLAVSTRPETSGREPGERR